MSANFEKLKVWQLSHALTVEVYKATKSFPKEETFAMISQMRRAAYSIPSNIVEGRSRRSQKEFARFLDIARASADELTYFLLLSRDVGYLNDADYERLVANTKHIAAMLSNLINRVSK